MKAANRTAGTTQDRTLLSLANWSGAAEPVRSSVAAPQKAKPAVSPLLAGLAGSAKPETRPAPVPAKAVLPALVTEPTLFELLKARQGGSAAPAARAVDVGRAAKPLLPRLSPGPSRATSRLRWLAVPIFAFAGAGAGYLTAPAPLYSARSELILKAEGVRGAAGMQPSQAERAEVPADAVQQSMARIASPDVLEPVVDELGLAADAGFGAGDRAAALEKLSGRLSAQQQTLTAGYTVTAQAPDAALSGNIANAVADKLVETHDPDAAGPPPTRLEVAFRAMPGTAGAEQLPLIPTGIGGAIGAGLGLAFALGVGRRRQPGGAGKPAAAPVPSTPPSPPARRDIPATGAKVRNDSVPPAAKPSVVAQAPAPKASPTIVPRSSFLDGVRERLLPATQAIPAVADATTTSAEPVPAAEPAAAQEILDSTPQPDTAMYAQHPLQPLAAYPQAPQTPSTWWPQAPGVGPAQPAPVAQSYQSAPPYPGAPSYPTAQPYPAVQPFQQAPAYSPAIQGYPHPASMPGYPQPAGYYPPAMPHPMAAMPPQPQWFAGMQPQVHHIPVPIPVPYPVAMPMPSAGPVIQHEAPRSEAPRFEEPRYAAPRYEAPRAAPRPVRAVEPEIDHSEETLAAIDEVRAQLRAFAGSLDALKAARSA